MNLNRKNLSAFIICIILGLIVGSLAWEVLERLVRQLGGSVSLTMEEPIRLFDLYVISLSVRANPGTILGPLGGVVLFTRL